MEWHGLHSKNSFYVMHACTNACQNVVIVVCTILQTNFHLEIDRKCVKSNVSVHHDILKQTFLSINSYKTVISKNLFLAFLYNLQTYSKTNYVVVS